MGKIKETPTNPENEVKEIETEILPDLVTVAAADIEALINQNLTMKTEIGQLVSLFKNFEGLISGKGIGSLMMSLPKLINNPEVGAQISAIAPIIEKYTTTP